MSIINLKRPNFKTDGFEIVRCDYLKDPEFQALQQRVYSKLSPARNATSELPRGIGWGVVLHGQTHWTSDDEYMLSAELNPEEAGRVRTMDRLPETFLTSEQMERLVIDTLAKYHPDADSHRRPYIVQVSAIRYNPTVTRTCYPSPDAPHQDGFNNGIFVLSRTENLVGGATRLFEIDGSPAFETMLDVGQGIYVEDKRWLHQVLPMMVNTSIGDSEVCHRDIVIVRIDPAHR